RYDPRLKRFRVVTNFDLALKPGVAQYTGHPEEITAQPTPAGPYAIIEFTGSLPRALLLSDWQVTTNYEAALTTLASDTFDPSRTVLVDHVPRSMAPSRSAESTGTVDFISYNPRQIKLR